MGVRLAETALRLFVQLAHTAGRSSAGAVLSSNT